MNSEATPESVADDGQSAGASAASNGGDGQGSNQVAPADPFSGLEGDTRKWVETKGYKSVPDVVTAALNAEKLIGRSVQRPGENAKPEEIDAYLDKATAPYRPKDAAGYEYKLPDGLPEDFAYDKGFADESKGWAADARLTGKQAALLHDKWVGKQAEVHKQMREELAKQVTETADALVREWGPLDGEKFKNEAELAHRALRGLELEDSFHKLGLLSQIGEDRNVVRDPKVALALARVGRELFKEDSLVTGESGGGAGANPFLTGNATEQNILWNKDRQKALTLIQAAGKNPADFGYRV